jgi:HTH-type transcriptional regulator, competence development regulator
MEAQPGFGKYVRARREALQRQDPRAFTLRAIAGKLDVQPAFLSMVERGVCGPPSEGVIKKLAEVLQDDPDVLLALAGKLSADLREIIIKRPRLFAELIRELRETPDQTIYRVVREVRDGNW